MKTTATKRTVTLVLALILIVSAFPLSASAASSWPTLTSSSPCVMISPGQISVYRDSGLTTRGTCSPARSYNSYIDMGDDLRLLEVSSNSLSIKVDFPTPQGRKQGFVQTSTLLGVSEPSQVVTSKAKVTTYQYASTEKTYGAVYVGDTVFMCGTTKGGYVLVIYNISGGYKAGFVLKSDWEKIVGDSQNASVVNTTEASVRSRFDAIGNGTLRYDSNTVMTIGARFTGSRDGEQCKGYAKNVFYMCFGITPGSTQPRNQGLNYLLTSTSGITKLGSVTNMTTSGISALFANARPGDFVQMRRNHGGSHSAIVYGVTSNGVTFLEANLDNQNTVYLRTYTWADLCSKNAAMTVYTATNYQLR